MKKYKIGGGVVAVVMVVSLVLAVSPVMADKPIDVIQKSNGFPSGQHFNLNLHGRDPSWIPGDIEAGGRSIYISNDSNDENTIEYVSNKKNKNDLTLYVIDPLSEVFGPPYDPAQVYLPYNIWDDQNDDDIQDPSEIASAEGYFVFGRSLGKPNAGSTGNSTIMIYPNIVVSANTSENETWPSGLGGHVYLDVGLITSSGNLYQSTEDGYIKFDRFENEKGNKRGKSKAKPITELFWWSGYVTDNTSLDRNGDGKLTIEDVGDNSTAYPYTVWSEWLASELIWGDADGRVSEEEVLDWLQWLVDEGTYGVTLEGPTWIFDIANMVISGQKVINDGTKLFQIRFYPCSTTTFPDFDPENPDPYS